MTRPLLPRSYKNRTNEHILKRQGALTIYKNHPGGNLVHKHKTIKLDVVGELLTRYKVNQNEVN